MSGIFEANIDINVRKLVCQVYHYMDTNCVQQKETGEKIWRNLKCGTIKKY